MKSVKIAFWGTIRTTLCCATVYGAEDFPKPYSSPCVERENVFEFTEKPVCKYLGDDRFEITFAVKGFCDVTVGIVDPDPTKELVKGKGVVVRHLASGVLGSNAPAPFQKNSLKQTLYWDGKCDLDVYHRNPGNLRVRVMLGLKPEFDKLLLGNSPHIHAPWVWGIVAGPEAVYVFSKGEHVMCRAYDHDGNYLRSLLPPPANLPDEKLVGYDFIEYESGKRALHAPGTYSTTAARGGLISTADNGDRGMKLSQPFWHGGNIYFVGCTLHHSGRDFYLHWLSGDGSGSAAGLRGRKLGTHGGNNLARAAFSPKDGMFYLTSGKFTHTGYGGEGSGYGAAVFRVALTGTEVMKPFVGDPGKPGADNAHFQGAASAACDAAGRVYVCDRGNSRLQVFDAEGKFLKTVCLERPEQIQIHPKTGAVFVLHLARVEGQTVSRLTKLTSFDNLTEDYHVDGLGGQALALDSYTDKPRLWFGTGHNIKVYEEDGKGLRPLFDFASMGQKEEPNHAAGFWGGSGEGDRVSCDATREEAYFRNSLVFDLKSGRAVRQVRIIGDDIAFDKYGYLHVHFNPGFYWPGIGRVDPEQRKEQRRRENEPPRAWPHVTYEEVPYDYGIEGEGAAKGWIGVIATKDQPGPKFFQDGIGVNMRGDVVENCNIYYVPKMDDVTKALWWDGPAARGKEGQWVDSCVSQNFNRLMEAYKKGAEDVYFIRRRPGIPLGGATAWTFDRFGELMGECAVTAGDLLNGVQLDENGAVYFVTARPRMYGDMDFFLKSKAGSFGEGKPTYHPFTGTLIKTKSDGKCDVLLARAPIPLDPLPTRPPELLGVDYMDEEYMGKNSWCWVEGAEWLYAGASPIVSVGCSCPTQRMHLDWYKRVFVPEAYRRSFGVLDTAGNLIMHLGRHGNYDSGFGDKSKIPVGGDNIAVFMPRFISGTDNYLVFSDWGERLVSLKVAYHHEETVPIRMK